MILNEICDKIAGNYQIYHCSNQNCRSPLLSMVIIIIIIIITSTNDLQPSTPIANQLPGQLVSTEIRTMHKNEF